jgi:hypothetical protein
VIVINFQEAYKKIRPSIVGLGFRNDPEYLIVGSGFLVHQSGWVMTNRHVLDALLTTRDGIRNLNIKDCRSEMMPR